MKRQQILFIRPKKKTLDGPPPKDDGQEEEGDILHKDLLAHTQKEADSIREHSAKFEKLVTKSDKTLLKIHTVFPFDFFPDTIVIDENKLNIIHRMFFWTAEIISIPIHHIQDVEVDTSVFFATLKILPTGYSVVSYTENWIKVSYLWKKEALRARRLVVGLVTGKREGIDFSKVKTAKFTKKIEELGKIV